MTSEIVTMNSGGLKILKDYDSEDIQKLNIKLPFSSFFYCERVTVHFYSYLILFYVIKSKAGHQTLKRQAKITETNKKIKDT